MDRPWLAEHAVDPLQAARLIAEQMPALAHLPVRPLAEGWDNSAFAVGDAWIFRFPRRQLAVDLLETEIRVLPAIAPLLPAPVPVPEQLGVPTGAFPAPFAGYRRLAGTTGCAHPFAPGEHRRLARELAAFLRALHAIPPGADGHPPGDTLCRVDLSRREARLRAQLEGARRLGFAPQADEGLALLDAALDELAAHPAPLRQDALVHGDLYGRHLLVGPGGALAGIIDWGDVHRGDPAVDLAVAYSFLPRDARRDFFAAYGEIDPPTRAKARGRALTSACGILAYGADVGDAGMIGLGIRGLALLAEAG